MFVYHQNQVHQGSQKGMCRCLFKGITICLNEPVRNLKENMWKERREWGLFFD
jgi:flagellin-specific chaperone FliS